MANVFNCNYTINNNGNFVFLAASKASNTQIKAIKEQNKADIEKLIEQNKVNIEALKRKHILDMEIKEKEYSHQIEIMKLQHSNEMKKEEENVKNQFAVSALEGFLMESFQKIALYLGS